jgi:hypothetical protein
MKAVKEETFKPNHVEPNENYIKPKSAKTMIPIKQKSVENLIDEHDDMESTPGIDERGWYFKKFCLHR